MTQGIPLPLELSKAVLLREAGDVAAAKAMLQDLWHRHPEAAQVRYQLAWCHDVLGEELEAIAHYRAAIEGDLSDTDLEGAYLGLGSTYRAVGQYTLSRDTLQAAMVRFPQQQEFKVFLALTCYNLGAYDEGYRLLLDALLSTTSDPKLRQYEKALRLYAQDLQRVWN